VPFMTRAGDRGETSYLAKNWIEQLA